jgi:hypothetical protein
VVIFQKTSQTLARATFFSKNIKLLFSGIYNQTFEREGGREREENGSFETGVGTMYTIP